VNTFTYVDSPIGRLLLRCDGSALTGLYMNVALGPPRGADEGVEDANSALLLQARGSWRNTSRAGGAIFDLPLRLHGTDFQRRVWNALQEIPYGATWSYGELARRIANPSASRAVGSRTGATPSPSWFPATGSSAPMDP